MTFLEAGIFVLAVIFLAALFVLGKAVV
jgi:hypothetical protein